MRKEKREEMRRDEKMRKLEEGRGNEERCEEMRRKERKLSSYILESKQQ